jgi:uncharacterized membrane protein (DUF2068 family)
MPRAHSQRGLLLIGALKLLKSATLIALGVGALKFLHKDIAAEAANWFDSLNVDPNNPYVLRLLQKLSTVDPRKLKELSVGTFLYAGIYLTEGVGLILRKRWAEYLTIISTAGFIPLEIYEIAKHLSVVRVLVLLVNMVIVIYLVWDLRHAPGGRRRADLHRLDLLDGCTDKKGSRSSSC